MDFDKKYYKIKDVAEFLGIPPTTLRYWETEFPDLKPTRTPSGIRYYTPDDIHLLEIIKFLVKIRGLKIDAAKREIFSNRKNLSKKLKIINNLEVVRDDLSMLLKSLKKLPTADSPNP